MTAIFTELPPLNKMVQDTHATLPKDARCGIIGEVARPVAEPLSLFARDPLEDHTP
jgi:hypothetical protein